MRRRGRGGALALLTAAALLASGCSGGDEGCTGATYDVDPAAEGSETPIDALDTWLGAPEGIDAEPPVENWIRQDSGDADADTVVLVNDDGDGWWVSVRRTTPGGWVVEQATDQADGCADLG